MGAVRLALTAVAAAVGVEAKSYDEIVRRVDTATGTLESAMLWIQANESLIAEETKKSQAPETKRATTPKNATKKNKSLSPRAEIDGSKACPSCNCFVGVKHMFCVTCGHKLKR